MWAAYKGLSATVLILICGREKTTTANIGVDFSMFRNRLNGSIEYYNKSGVDLLANTNGVPTEGFGFLLIP